MATQQSWYSLFVPLDDQKRIADALGQALEAQGFTRYDPFPGGTGLSFGWKQRVRLFVAPPEGGWTRVVGHPPEAILPALAAALETNVLLVWLDETGGGVCAWTPEGCDNDADTLADWLAADASIKDLQLAMRGDVVAPLLAEDGPQALAVPLPPEVAALADRVDEQEAEQLMQRITRSVMGRLGRDAAQARHEARGLLSGGVPWNSEAGRRIRAVMGCLSVPGNWLAPELETLVGAYQVARARQHRPEGGRLPGDDVALAAVPDALAFTPVYAGLR
ncbi:MAG: hypothetical protein Kow0077_09020 [Anaerolineae bacterium]